MQNLPGIVPKTAQVIKAARFFTALQQAWKPADTSGQQKLGLAISGGLDSMALASLCHSVTKLPEGHRGKHEFKFYPMIVDHKAREGSTEEALLVSKRLRELLGVKPTILTLDWPGGVQPSDLSRFESEARRLRYQALGRACQLRGVESLLVAHHADDQAETILTRLAHGHGSLGLQGIRPSNEIPECWGIHGVHQSGKSRVLNQGADDLLRRAERVHTTGLNKRHIPIEGGGVVVCRPLLSFTKNELIATCQYHRVQWVEDETNKDPTRTVRNATRNLISSGKLPRALRRRRLLTLAHKIQLQIERRKQFAVRLLRATCIKTCDLRSGTISIQVPIPASSISWHNSTINSLMERNTGHYQYEVGMALRRLMEVVSPLETIPMTNVKPATEIISGGKKAPPAFTAAGVMFVRSREMLPCDHALKIWTQYHPKAKGPRRKSVQAAFKTSLAYVWTLTREPYHSRAHLPVIPIQLDRSALGRPQNSPQSFHLWDGRFWIKVNNLTGHPLCIRHFAPNDIKPFQEALDIENQRPFTELLRTIPYNARLTLPAIAFADDAVVKKGESRVLALPSLGAAAKQWEGKLSWKLRYKHIDLNCHSGSMRWK